jgi:hypothetical protein
LQRNWWDGKKRGDFSTPHQEREREGKRKKEKKERKRHSEKGTLKLVAEWR